jgi:PAS domain-containing protein
MKLLANPMFLRMAAVAFAALIAFVFGWVVIRRLKQGLQDEGRSADPATESFPLHTYHAVIQQLKQQKHELESLQQAERRRAKTTENISAAVLSNLSCGVVFFNTAGLVKQANSAARRILGLASPIGMNARELFRHTSVFDKSRGAVLNLADVIASAGRNAAGFRGDDTDYTTPAGEARVLEITVSPVYAANAELLGSACLIDDDTQIAHLRRDQKLHGEISAEMALSLRNSVALISEYARNLAGNRDTAKSEQIANDIGCEAEHLQRTIGGFLLSAPGKAVSGVS